MLKISSDRVVFEFASTAETIATVPLDEVFAVETRDGLDGQLSEGATQMPEIKRANPLTGPIAVEGIAAGEGICVDILAVDPAPSGYLTFQSSPRFFAQTARLLRFVQDVRLPLEPMIGTIGVMPASGTYTSKDAGDYGGNMDTRDIAAGCSLYLKCQIEGAGLALGDVHSLQGDGETSGQGAETAATVTLRVRRAGKLLSPRPYIVRNGRLMVIASADTLEEASAEAIEETASILTTYSRLSYQEARILISVAGDLVIGQIVNPQKTVRLSLPLEAVPWDFSSGLPEGIL
jgi:amidase